MARILHIHEGAPDAHGIAGELVAQGHEAFAAPSELAFRACAETSFALVFIDDGHGRDALELVCAVRGLQAGAQPWIIVRTRRERHAEATALGADRCIAEDSVAAEALDAMRDALARPRAFRTRNAEPIAAEVVERIALRLAEKDAALRVTNDRLAALTEARDAFFRNLSHEMATPLTPVVGYLKLLLKEELGPLTAVQKKALISIEAGAARLRSLLDDLLDVSALETGTLHFFTRDYDVGTVVERACTEMRPRFEERRVTLLVERPPGRHFARGDSDKLRRALAHLLDNAAKFTPPGGKALLRLRRLELDGAYEVVLVDSGEGVPSSRMGSVLEALRQGDASLTRRHGGIGVGLSFARRVAEGMGGHIQLESPPRADLSALGFAGTEVRLVVSADPPGDASKVARKSQDDAA